MCSTMNYVPENKPDYGTSSRYHTLGLQCSVVHFFALFIFICSRSRRTSRLPNSTKFVVKFTTSFRSSRFDCQLRNEIAKSVENFGNFKRNRLSEVLRNTL